MKQEDRKILIQDITGRIQYGVKFDFDGLVGKAIHICCYPICNENGTDDCICELDIFGGGGDNFIDVEYLKPYLFPLSSMTEEQKREYNSLRDFVPTYHYEYGDIVEDTELYDNWGSIDYLIANHFDYRGLIEKGVAIDATGLNIY